MLKAALNATKLKVKLYLSYFNSMFFFLHQTRIPDSQMTLFDKMAALTHNRFNSLMTTIPETLTGRKVIAGLVMKIDHFDTGTVIAIGSGLTRNDIYLFISCFELKFKSYSIH